MRAKKVTLITVLSLLIILFSFNLVHAKEMEMQWDWDRYPKVFAVVWDGDFEKIATNTPEARKAILDAMHERYGDKYIVVFPQEAFDAETQRIIEARKAGTFKTVDVPTPEGCPPNDYTDFLQRSGIDIMYTIIPRDARVNHITFRNPRVDSFEICDINVNVSNRLLLNNGWIKYATGSQAKRHTNMKGIAKDLVMQCFIEDRVMTLQYGFYKFLDPVGYEEYNKDRHDGPWVEVF